MSSKKDILTKYAKEKGVRNLTCFVDDGVSGATFDRPDFNRMIAAVESGAVTTLLFDDMCAFRELLRKQRFEEAEKAMKQKKLTLAQSQKRIADLDRIFKRIYEDDIAGNISHDRYNFIGEVDLPENTDSETTDKNSKTA